MREYTGVTDLTDDPVELQVAREEATAQGRSWAKRQRSVDEQCSVPKPAKRPRTKSYEFNLAVHTMLLHHTGRGLEQFVTTDAEGNPVDPHDWKFLSLSPDQGPDCKCGTNNLTYGPLMLNIDVVDDFTHGGHNDVKGAWKFVGILWFQVFPS